MEVVAVLGLVGFFSSFLSVYLVPLRAKIPKRIISLSASPRQIFSLGILRFIAFRPLY